MSCCWKSDSPLGPEAHERASDVRLFGSRQRHLPACGRLPYQSHRRGPRSALFPDSVPGAALFQQRRRSTRYQLPLRTGNTAASITLQRSVTIDRDHSDILTGEMLDVSAGGCRLSIDGPVHPPKQADETLRQFSVRIPGRFELGAKAEIRHAAYYKLTRKVICEVEFTGMEITDRRRLEQFLQMLSRNDPNT